MQTAKASRKQSSLSGKESAQGCSPSFIVLFFFFLIAHLSFAFAFDEPHRVPEAQRGGLFLSPK